MISSPSLLDDIALKKLHFESRAKPNNHVKCVYKIAACSSVMFPCVCCLTCGISCQFEKSFLLLAGATWIRSDFSFHWDTHWHLPVPPQARWAMPKHRRQYSWNSAIFLFRLASCQPNRDGTVKSNFSLVRFSLIVLPHVTKNRGLK